MGGGGWWFRWWGSLGRKTTQCVEIMLLKSQRYVWLKAQQKSKGVQRNVIHSEPSLSTSLADGRCPMEALALVGDDYLQLPIDDRRQTIDPLAAHKGPLI